MLQSHDRGPCSRLAAVLLAAGASSRFGSDNKLLAQIGGVPIIRIVASIVLRAQIGQVIVVTGYDHERVANSLVDMPVTIVQNLHWEQGMGTSIAAGMRGLADGWQGVFIVPGDMACLTSEIFECLARAFTRGEPVVVPISADLQEQRNPVLWPRRYFGLLSDLRGPSGAKSILSTIASERIEVPFAPEVFTDVDTQAELAALNASRKRS